MLNEYGTFFEAVVGALQQASIETNQDQVPPTVLLWPDKKCEWFPLLPRLRVALPLLTLGNYKPEERSGPAYWLLCVIARTLPHVLNPGQIPILYLPGLSIQELRAIADLPKLVQPLAALQFLGAIWKQKKSGRDWTVHAFLKYGLGIDVHADTETKTALCRALPWLADESVARLRDGAPLQATFFETLLASREDLHDSQKEFENGATL